MLDHRTTMAGGAARTTHPCSICGREIFWDHGFKKRNLRRHEMACAYVKPEARAKRAAAAPRVRQRARKRRRKHRNQLELKFDPEEKKP